MQLEVPVPSLLSSINCPCCLISTMRLIYFPLRSIEVFCLCCNIHTGLLLSLEMSDKVETGFSCIGDLTRTGEHRIVVRVCNSWDASLPTRPDKIISYNVLFVDEKGNEIQAVCHPEESHRFKGKLSNGSIVVLANFAVQDNVRSYRYAFGLYSLRFTRATIVYMYFGPPVDIPRYAFKFVPFNLLEDRAKGTLNMLDILGSLICITYPNSNTLSGKGVPGKIITVMDNRGKQTDVALWHPFSDKLCEEQFSDRSKKLPVLIAMKGMSVKSFNDSVRLSNTSGSIILVDEAIPGYDEYVNSFAQVDITVVDQRTINVPSDVAEIPLRTIAQLLQLDQFGDQYAMYRCAVTVNCIDEKKGCWYKGCTACKRLVVKDDHGYMCRRCGVKDSFIARFKTILGVSDSSGSAEFLLFDGPCAELFRVTAPVALKASPDGIACPKFMHKHVENRNIIFDVKVNSTDSPGDTRSYIVAKLHSSEDGSSSSAVSTETDASAFSTPTKNMIAIEPRSSTPMTPMELEILKKINIPAVVDVSSGIDEYSLIPASHPTECDAIKSDALPNEVTDKLYEQPVDDGKSVKRRLEFFEKINLATASHPTAKRSVRAKTSKLSSIIAPSEP